MLRWLKIEDKADGDQRAKFLIGGTDRRSISEQTMEKLLKTKGDH